MKHALISVSNKEGIVECARELHKLGIAIIASGRTAKLLRDNGVPARHVSEITHFPEILNGRIKTLHPAIEGGILALRDKEEHMKQLQELHIPPIDIVIANLYPFEETIQKEVSLNEALENIDIGGPTMIRAAAKNFEHVVVIVDLNTYNVILEELRTNGEVSRETRLKLAIDAFRHMAEYDSIITEFFKRQAGEELFPDILNLGFKKVQELRYGENPHQKAALYTEFMSNRTSVVNAVRLQEIKKLSYNNLLDLDTALNLVMEFADPTVTIIKHTSPCGAACGATISEAYDKAFASDPVSAFGGVIGANRIIDIETAQKIASIFFDAIIAPDYEEGAVSILKQKRDLRILKTGPFIRPSNSVYLRKISGGLLIQENDSIDVKTRLKVVTEVQPTQEQIEALLFAWTVVKYVKSNAIVIVKAKRTLGIGLGQTSRVDAVKIALEKAGDAHGAVLASDGFFPFRDSIDEAGPAGIAAIIQPGGSIRDKEVIDAANEYKIPMLFTGIRAFRH
jgi:phosphoribosylaminoimidazolecarboxamide formyltransferase/IMP cyclohydrolase